MGDNRTFYWRVTSVIRILCLNVAQGSIQECRYYLILIRDLGYGTTLEMQALLEEVSKLAVAYASAIESNRRATREFCSS